MKSTPEPIAALVTEKMCSYSDLIDGTLGVDDVYRLLEMLIIQRSNEKRLHDHAEREAKSKSKGR